MKPLNIATVTGEERECEGRWEGREYLMWTILAQTRIIPGKSSIISFFLLAIALAEITGDSSVCSSLSVVTTKHSRIFS
jgi:hypothetical protein